VKIGKVDKKPTAGIILAAGTSTRLGRPKQLLKLAGKFLLEWVIEAALQSELETLILVLGHEHQMIRQSLGDKIQQGRLTVVVGHQYRNGLSHSLETGLLTVAQKYDSVMFLLGDQPLVGTGNINQMLTEFWQSDKEICVPVCQGKRGNPTIFCSSFYEQLLEIKGDMGARNIIQANPQTVLRVELADPLCFFDVDTEKDFNDLQAVLK